jgi:predicted DNA-binding protein with PD1-like motif
LFKKIHVFRVKPDQERPTEILAYCRQNSITTGVVIGLIGSLKNARLNYLVELPGKYVPIDYSGPLEIVSAQGSVALKDGEIILHMHIQLSSQEGCYGGHLAGATVFSTAEVVIGELDRQLQRYSDDYTGLNELMAEG